MGSFWADRVSEVLQISLAKTVERIRKTARTPGGRRYTKLEIVTKIAKRQRPGDPFHGINPKTLLSLVTHAGPNSMLRKEYRDRQAQLVEHIERLINTVDFQA